MRRVGVIHARIAIGALALLTLAVPARPFAAADPGRGGELAVGRLDGSVRIGSQLVSRRARLRLYAEPNQAGFVPPAPAPDAEMRNVVVYLVPVSGRPEAAPRPVGPLVMRQVNQAFEPHILVVPKGAAVEFPNADPIFHNVFSLSKAKSFDLGHYPKGASKSVVFDQTGVVKVYCHLHADMGAVILVVDNPWYASPDGEGRFRMEEIPAGEYEAVGWHERAHPVRRRVTIEPGATATATFHIPLLDEPADE